MVPEDDIEDEIEEAAETAGEPQEIGRKSVDILVPRNEDGSPGSGLVFGLPDFEGQAVSVVVKCEVAPVRYTVDGTEPSNAPPSNGTVLYPGQSRTLTVVKNEDGTEVDQIAGFRARAMTEKQGRLEIHVLG